MSEQLVSSQVLLAWINNRLQVVSEVMHRLACERQLLQEQATRLRLGASVAEVRAALERGGAVQTDPDTWELTAGAWRSSIDGTRRDER